MMDQLLQVPFSVKIHKILERQEKLAGEIDELTVWRNNVYGFLGSLANALCCFWCTRPWANDEASVRLPNDVESNANHSDDDVPIVVESDTTHSLERKCPACAKHIVDAPYNFVQFLFSKDRLPACILNLKCGWLPACVKGWISNNLEWGRSWVIVVEWLDTVQTLALLPLSWYVITNSSTVIDVLVNVASVSVFARLDDETVEMFTKPRQSLLDRWRLYTGSEDNLRRSGKINIEFESQEEEERHRLVED